MTFDFSEFNTFCREQNMDFETSEKITFSAFSEISDNVSRENFVLTAHSVSEYMCDNCNEEPAQTWHDDLGAICNTCCGCISNHVKIISDGDINY